MNINFVVKKLFPDEKIKEDRDYYIQCPFCDSRKKPMNINPIKGVFRCNRCGESGSAVTLYAKAKGIDYDHAKAELKEQGLSQAVTVQNTKKEVEIAPLVVRDAMYRSLLSQTTLSIKHRLDLQKRGLSNADIERLGYKTVPVVGLSTIAEKCFSDMIGDVFFNEELTANDIHIKMTPGFYKKSSEIGEYALVAKKDGYLIPVKTFDGKISCFQVRHNPLSEDATEEEKENYSKYTYLNSSFKSTGVSISGCENIHFTGFNGKIPKEVYLTEGCLKADIASTLSKKAFIAVMGVNNVSQLPNVLKMLKKGGCERINLCFDMDYQDKEQVKKALDTVAKMISKAKLDCKVCKWPSKYKGIDDYCLAKRRSH